MIERSLLWVVLAVLAAGCASWGNETGRVSARGTGDVSGEPVPRVAFDAAMIAACGEGRVKVEDAIARLPYVQQVTDASATVLWTAVQDTPMELLVTRPDGTRVRSHLSAVDGAARPRDAHQHVARVRDLEPGTTYCYEIRLGDTILVGRTGFRTAPAASGAPVTFTVVGDMGSGDVDQFHVLEHLESVPFDLILTVGDNAYDDGALAELEAHFFDVYAPILRSIPVFPTAGNHDYRTDDAAPFREVFALPENGAPDGHERWYSFDWGDVHFVALDTELAGPAQAEWLDLDLADNDRPWTVVYGHRPPYSSGAHGGSASVRQTFGPIFERHAVPLVLAGHDHDYERTEPIDGTVYVVTGGGGRGTRGVGSSSWTAYSEDVLHFLWGRVEGDRLELHAIDASGREFDSVVIRRR